MNAEYKVCPECGETAEFYPKTSMCKTCHNQVTGQARRNRESLFYGSKRTILAELQNLLALIEEDAEAGRVQAEEYRTRITILTDRIIDL